jgi:hypothetical protein
MFQGKRRCVVGSAFLAIAVCITSGMVSAQGVPLYPDIVEQIAHLQIQNEHQREMLRFSTTHINIGDGPLQIRGGGQVAPCVIDGTAYAQCTYATQEVLDAAGNIVHSQPAGVALTGYVRSARQNAERRIILAGYRLADLLRDL